MSSYGSKANAHKVFSQEDYHRLHEENQILQGKIRGYLTLGEILTEQKEENAKLESKNQELMYKLSQLEAMANKTISRTSHNSEIEKPQLGRTKDEKLVDGVQNGFGNQVKKDTSSSNGYSHQQTHCETYFNIDETSSLRGVKYPPDDLSNDPVNITTSKEKFPTQESLEMDIKEVKLTEMKGSESTSSSSIEKIDNPRDSIESYTFIDKMVKRPVSSKLNHQESVKAGFGSSSPTIGSLNLMEFPSVKSGENNSATRGMQEIFLPPSYLSGVTKEVRSDDEGDRILSVKITEVAEALDLTVDGPAEKLRKLLDELLPDITRQEEEAIKYKKENIKLNQENQKMKDECMLLQIRIQKLESQVNNVSPLPPLSSPSDWEHVHVHRSQTQRNEAMEDRKLVEDLQRRLAAQEEQNKKLAEANTRWQNLWSKMGQGTEIEYVKAENERLKNHITMYEKQDEKRQQDFDKILLTAKQAQNEAEAAKDELQRQLEMATVKAEALEVHVSETEKRCQQLEMEKQALNVEIDVVKGGAARLPQNSLNRSVTELRTENAVLREQLTVFQEDFDKERTDRAQAQASKADLQKKLDAEKRETSRLKRDLQNLQRQLKVTEDNLQQTLRQSQALQQENTNLRTQIRRDRPTATNMYQPYHPAVQPVGYHNHEAHVPTHPETEPYEGPVPPYMFNRERRYMNGYGNEISNRQAVSPEQMPGSWMCPQCTYYNHPKRTVCEMCGKVYNGPFYNNSSNVSQPLMPRGELNVNLDESNDLCIDSGKFEVPDK